MSEAKRDWLLQSIGRHARLSNSLSTIERRSDLTRKEFLNRYYSKGIPVIIQGEMDNWPALTKWNPQYLKETIGHTTIECQVNRSRSETFELNKAQHRTKMYFDDFIDKITKESGNDTYMTAWNSHNNDEAIRKLNKDRLFLRKFLDPNKSWPIGMMWIGPANTLTPLHHDLTNNMISQLVGRKQMIVVPSWDVMNIYNHVSVFSEIVDLDDPNIDYDKYPLLKKLCKYYVELAPGEMIFMPVAWWHQVRSLDFSVTVTYTNFIWDNNSNIGFPQ